MNRIFRFVSFAGVAASVVLGTLTAWGAITGSISGVVTDPSGAVIPGVTVVATSVSTNVQSTAVTDSKGFFNLPTLNVDTYNLSATQAGFRDYQQTGIKIDANSAVRVDITLQLGTVTNTVSVKSDTLQVETQSTQNGVVIQDTKITSVPLNGRSYIDLLKLQPGVSPYSHSTDSSTSGVGATQVSGDLDNGQQSVNGGRTGSNAFMVNGANAEEGVHNGAAMIPNLDSIAQFRIITNNFDAEYGNYAGGQVNVVTKSGTNQFHGTVFNFLRNTDLDARNYYSPTRGVFIQNQFGGTVGGPIRRNKIFFFADYQGTRQILGQTQSYPVPSDSDRTGDLSDQAGSLTGTVVGAGWANTLSQKLGYAVSQGENYYTPGCSDTATCVFPNANIPQTAWSSVAVNSLKFVPSANGVINGSPNFSTSAYNETLSDDKGSGRVDVPTRAGAVFGYYFFDQYNTVNPYSQVNVPGFAATNKGKTQMINLGLTTTFNSSTVNDLRLAYLRDVNQTGQPTAGQGLGVSLASQGFVTPWGPAGGISPINPSYEGVANFMFNNFSLGVPPDALRQYNNTFQIIDNVTKILGTHTLQFGTNLHYNQINERNYDCYNGCFGFNGSETGLDFADFLIGAPASFVQASQQLLDSRSKYYGFYAQDSWRATRNLTINYGLRWEAATPWYDTQNKLETVVPGQQSLSFPGAPLGLVVPLDPGIPRTLGPTKYTNFGPRIGFAYAPDVSDGFLHKILGGSGKSSIRAGYGIFYSSIEDATGFVEVGDAPYGNYYSVSSTELATPFVDRPSGNPAGQKFPFVFPPTNVSPQNPDTTFDWAAATPIGGSDYYYYKNKMPYVQEWQLSFQRQLGTATVLSLTYVGTVGRQLLTFEESNPGDQALCLQLSNPANVAPGTTTCGPYGEDTIYTTASGQTISGTRPTFGINFNSNPYMKTAVSSSFNSLQVTLEHTEKYLNFLIGYTFEKSLDNGSDSFDATNPLDPSQTRALSSFDVPNNLVASYTVQLPFDHFIGGGDIAKRFSAGWELSGVATFATGEPVTLNENDDNSLLGAFNANVDVPSYADNGSSLIVNKNPRKGLPYFNPNFFQPEPIGQVGNAMRRYFSGPGINNWDMALLKSTAITEGTKLQFRAEAFNVFNHAQFANPSGLVNNTGQGGFGYVTSTGGNQPRIMQVALKLLF
ncbi:MAG TPA: TonB-dependent receptor [Acidobacteriaceae bacterium]|nr:TonB-dependent receptor [Acidobacteriaceae bacterium]